MTMFKKNVFFGLLIMSFSQNLLAQANLSYPELDVTPRASERLLMLAEKEKKASLLSQLPLQVSALSTLTTGLLQMGNVKENDDPQKKSPAVGLIVGASWVGINYYMSQRYMIYEKTLSEVNQVQGKTQRDQLIRERLAEEGINRAASLAVRLKWLSVATNFTANTFMASKAKKDSAAQYMGAFSALLALGPIFFVSDWESVAQDQQSYKKKVYGPIFTTSLFETSDGKFSPGLLISQSF